LLAKAVVARMVCIFVVTSSTIKSKPTSDFGDLLR
jgi:hypothetical protein